MTGALVNVLMYGRKNVHMGRTSTNISISASATSDPALPAAFGTAIMIHVFL